jgi:hypothetical protein
MHISLINILVFNFLMSSTCFETEISSSRRRTRIQLRYGMFHMRQFKQSSRQKIVFVTAVFLKMYCRVQKM